MKKILASLAAMLALTAALYVFGWFIEQNVDPAQWERQLRGILSTFWFFGCVLIALWAR